MADKPKRVLIVEDDADLMSLMEHLLAQRGYIIETAANGREALEAVEQNLPDLILLDMKMPVMNGWEFVAEFTTRHDRATPIVVVTAAASAEQQAQQVHADGWVAKPFDVDGLVSTVKRFLDI